MQSSQTLTRVQWRKSSYSGGTGGDCVECATLGNTAWRKSSHSGNTGGACVEVADLTPHIAIRDSKNPAHGALTVTPESFARFVSATADGVFG
ncbi:toxin [Streptomyces sp. NBRC 14336]|uniref:DUF397 domain-containing protein n=1 Tax=Streptomyces sp. NBRC 14336 TaxID=3030992 RepID=UPI0024A24042|nr:DUF397 domain-containing protein [Streptomyces sp. NBRC 14336]WBO78709.1 DUF397 domain-containing protein [Streptomyces sp. SBE_14.2]GLW50876.1 toxin [Streptomyces sp. NBRC 14336]